MSSVTGTAQAGTSRSQYRGVRKRSCCRFAAEIRDPSKKRRVWLGTFDTSVEAALAYDRAATLLKGSRARTNFPPMDPTSAQYTPMKRVRRANLVPSWINSNMFVKSTVTRPWTHAYIKTGALDPLQMHPVFPQQNQTMPIIQPDGTGIGAGGGIRDGADSSVTDSGVSSSTSRHDERSLLDLNVPLPAAEEDEEEEEGGHDNSCKTLWLLN